jgi:hypothetical protein
MASQAVHHSPPQRSSDWLSVIPFITCNHAGNSFEKRVTGEVENELKIVGSSPTETCTPIYIIERE